MLTAVEIAAHASGAVLQTVPMGTNRALAHILWAMISGGFLPSRAAFFTALNAKGFAMQEVRRSGAPMRMGCQRTARQLAALCGE